MLEPKTIRKQSNQLVVALFSKMQTGDTVTFSSGCGETAQYVLLLEFLNPSL